MNAFIVIVSINLLLILVRLAFSTINREKILIANLFTSNVVAFIILYAFFTDYIGILDIALVYVMINFVSLVAFLKFFSYNNKNANAN